MNAPATLMRMLQRAMGWWNLSRVPIAPSVLPMQPHGGDLTVADIRRILYRGSDDFAELASTQDIPIGWESLSDSIGSEMLSQHDNSERHHRDD